MGMGWDWRRKGMAVWEIGILRSIYEYEYEYE
jgi:hypothetical protein